MSEPDGLQDALVEAAAIAHTDANRRAIVYQRGSTWLVLPSTTGLLGQIDASHRLAYLVTAVSDDR